MNRNGNIVMFLSGIITLWLCGYLNSYAGDDKVKFTMGYSIFSFQEVSPIDASAAISVYAKLSKEKIEKRLNKKIDFHYFVYNSLNDIKEALDKNEVDLLSISFTEYRELKKQYRITPCIAPSASDNAYEQYYFLKRNDSNLTKTEDLIGKNLSVPNFKNHPMLEEWLFNLLAKAGHRSINSAFRQVKVTENESSAIYNVFFGNSDCAVVRKSVYQAVCELNPQIKKTLSVFISSPSFIPIFSVVNENTNKVLIKAILDETKALQLTSQGKNILSIFKSESMIRINDDDLKAGLNILDENDYFKKQLTIKKRR